MRPRPRRTSRAAIAYVRRLPVGTPASLGFILGTRVQVVQDTGNTHLRHCVRNGGPTPRRACHIASTRTSVAWTFVVNVVPRLAQEYTTYAGDGRVSIEASDLRRVADDLEGLAGLVQKDITPGRTITAPPGINVADVCVSFWSGPDGQAHLRRRSSSRIAAAGRRRPVSADCHDAESASCSARRSSSVRSSPLSSATRSITVP